MTWRRRHRVWRGEGAGEAGRSAGLVPVGGDGGGSIQRDGAAETVGRSRGRGVSTARRRATAGPVAKSTGSGGSVRAAAQWENGGRGRKFLAVVYSCASAEMPCAAADASHLAPRIVQNTARTKKIAAPPQIARLLEGRFRLRALYIGGFLAHAHYSAPVGDALSLAPIHLHSGS
jgi:hypothetical protein